MFYIDWTYIILVMPAIIFSMWASMRVNTTFEKYSKQNSARRMTGAEAARRVLQANGVHNVRIEKISGNLTDHYDPKANVIRLSEAVHDSVSTAAIGVAAHEAGHAVQHAQNYAPVKIRTAIVPITNIGSKLAIPLVIVGILLSYVSAQYASIAYAGVAAFGLCVVFQLVTLPTEFNASRRALVAIEQCGILSRDELDGSRKVLTAAALTYVAALAVTLMQFLRLFLMVAGSSNRRK
ncbi:MAG: zinc metallopeptidase [Ruminococcaceae bacterium]|nr:zinc metallopeptidase [Oscillospiraceae bacterium]